MAKKTNREKGFVFYYSWEKIVMLFEDADVGKLFKALLHVRDNPSPETLPKAVQVAYLMIADQILRDADKYAETCERRRQAANQRWHPEEENTDPAVGDTEETNLDATDANALDAVQTSPTDAKENTNAKKKEKKIENAMEIEMQVKRKSSTQRSRRSWNRSPQTLVLSRMYLFLNQTGTPLFPKRTQPLRYPVCMRYQISIGVCSPVYKRLSS